jgi:hypothetical protein
MKMRSEEKCGNRVFRFLAGRLKVGKTEWFLNNNLKTNSYVSRCGPLIEEKAGAHQNW